ncbi:hypothetical protein SDC9_177838 [bioreactor metagenome]|uniref:Uncharacterized protein n=1 Tax=bioreactor metagenome TaxID=1076179 RepID=A0A645GUD8_9ZZZZ
MPNRLPMHAHSIDSRSAYVAVFDKHIDCFCIPVSDTAMSQRYIVDI